MIEPPEIRYATTSDGLHIAYQVEGSGSLDLVETGDRLRVDIRTGVIDNLTSGKSLRGTPPPEFLLEMVQAGGLIPLLKAGSRFFPSRA